MTQAPANAPGGPRDRGAVLTIDPEQQPDTTPPSWLTNADALNVWGAAVAMLASVRILNKSDLTALARYCKLLQEWIDLTATIDNDGHVVQDRFGQDKAHPAVGMRDGIERGLRQLEKALGLDPSSYEDLTKDLHRNAKNRGKVKGGHGVGGFLKKGGKK